MTAPTPHRVVARFGLVVAAILTTTPLLVTVRADAATIIASYETGHRDVTINGYGTTGLGAFRLADGDDRRVALCIEADVSHSTESHAYDVVPNRVDSPELDVLLWWLDRQASIDADTAAAAAALAWYYASARRSIGPLVWSDSSRDFAPITPVSPESWESLPRFTLSHMIGLKTGSTHLDRAERRVAELHALSTAWSTPWTIEPEPDRRAFILRSGDLPLAGVTVALTIDVPGSAPVERRVRTDTAGRAVTELPVFPDGATIIAAVDSPGAHREWDGPGSVQRMATATNRRVSATLDIAPRPRYVDVHKSSSDPTIGVAGARFELSDAHGEPIGTATTDAEGTASFGPIEPATHPAPYQLVEVAAPPGLVRSEEPLTIERASHEPARPTIVTIVNDAATVDLAIRKRFSQPGVGPPDRSGFRFVATRRSGGARHELVTGPSGMTPPTPLPVGEYTICETEVPDWAAVLVDGGCVTAVVDERTLGRSTVVIDYLNLAPDPELDTSASDAVDDDRSLSTAGGAVTDRVELTGLVPGTEYTLEGSVIAITGSDAPRDLGVDSSVTFVAEAGDTAVVLRFEIPPMGPGEIVIVESLLVDDIEVATHHDLDDPDQTLVITPPPTTTTSTTAASTTSTTTLAPPSTTSSPMSTAPTTAAPTIATTAPATTTTTTTAATATTATTTTSSMPPIVVESTAAPVVTLPVTGAPQTAATLVRLGDAGFVLGVTLVAAAGILPRRVGRDEAGR